MKKLLLLAVFLGSVTLNAAEVEVFKNVEITTCPLVPGCAARLLTQDAKAYTVDTSYVEELLTKNGHLTDKAKDIKAREVIAVVVMEKGYMPNPMHEFPVVKILKVIE